MDIEIVKSLIKKHIDAHTVFVQRAEVANRYYRNETDILFEEQKKDEDAENPLRNADNRIPFNFHRLLVDQKAAYMFTEPPTFDLGTDAANKALSKFFGDKFPKVCKDLCVEASNDSVGWVHVWNDRESGLKYAVVPAVEVVPIWNRSLEKKLLGVLRAYREITDDGQTLDVYEYWNDKTCEAYYKNAGDTIDAIVPYMLFMYTDEYGISQHVNEFEHGMGEVPFFSFDNNNIHASDLTPIKRLIDTYCKVYSGYANDLEDIQEIIFILTNYGGVDLNEFLTDIKRYKTVKIDNDGTGDSSGLQTLTIDIPVEAREKLLSITRKCIFEQGMGIDPDPENFGNSSGVALKFLYSLLEQKAGLMETEFRPSFGRMIRCICRILGVSIKDDRIVQTWTRTSVQNDLELAQIAATSQGMISQDTLLRNHPWVDDVEREVEQLNEDAEKAKEAMDEYREAFGAEKPEEEEPTDEE